MRSLINQKGLPCCPILNRLLRAEAMSLRGGLIFGTYYLDNLQVVIPILER
jgi:hypothetical protein